MTHLENTARELWEYVNPDGSWSRATDQPQYLKLAALFTQPRKVYQIYDGNIAMITFATRELAVDFVNENSKVEGFKGGLRIVEIVVVGDGWVNPGEKASPSGHPFSCPKCGNPNGEGGTAFSLCDECWKEQLASEDK